MDGVDSGLIGSIFKEELDGLVCEGALAPGYHLDGGDYNTDLYKLISSEYYG